MRQFISALVQRSAFIHAYTIEPSVGFTRVCESANRAAAAQKQLSRVRVRESARTNEIAERFW